MYNAGNLTYLKDQFQTMVQDRWARKQMEDPSVSHDTALKVTEAQLILIWIIIILDKWMVQLSWQKQWGCKWSSWEEALQGKAGDFTLWFAKYHYLS